MPKNRSPVSWTHGAGARADRARDVARIVILLFVLGLAPLAALRSLDYRRVLCLGHRRLARLAVRSVVQ